MLQSVNASNGSKIKEAIKGNQFAAIAALSAFKPLSDTARYEDKKALEKPLLYAINEYRESQGYEDNAGIEGHMYFLLQGEVGSGNYSDEIRKTKETLVQLMALLADPDVSEKMEGYTRGYAGSMLKRLYVFFKYVEDDGFLTYMDKQRLEGCHDYEIAAINRTLNTYRHYSGTGPVYLHDAEGMSPKDE